jgi:hypothetical protein
MYLYIGFSKGAFGLQRRYYCCTRMKVRIVMFFVHNIIVLFKVLSLLTVGLELLVLASKKLVFIYY